MAGRKRPDTSLRSGVLDVCRKHVWTSLFPAPATDAAFDVRAAWLGHCLHGHDRYMICTACGTLGSVRRGYSQGGTHATKPLCNPTLDRSELRAEAEAWKQLIT